MDESLITQELQKDPWVASATYERQFPHTLRITITERKVTAIGAGTYPVLFAQIRHYFLGSTAIKKTMEKHGLR